MGVLISWRSGQMKGVSALSQGRNGMPSSASAPNPAARITVRSSSQGRCRRRRSASRCVPVSGIAQEDDIPGVGQDEHGEHGDCEPQRVAARELPRGAEQQRGVADEEEAAEQEPAAGEDDARIAALPGAGRVGVQQQGQAEPEQDHGVEERHGDQRPVAQPFAHAGSQPPGHGAHSSRSFSASAWPSSSQRIRRPLAAMMQARVRATFSSVAFRFRSQAA